MKIASIWNPFKPQWFPIVQALPFVCTTGLGMSTTPHIFRPNWAFLIAGVVSEVSSRSASSFVTQRTGSDAIHPTDRTCDIFLAREIWFVNAGQLASRVACQEVPHLWLDCILIMFDHFWSVGSVSLFLSWKFPSSHTIQTARYIRNPHSAKTMSNNFARLWG